MTDLTPINVQRLVVLLRQRNSEGFSELYDKYAPALYGITCKIVRDEIAAEDVLQEVFVKVWRNIDQFDGSKGTFFTWLLNITRYTAIDYLRSRQYKYQSQNYIAPGNEYINDNGYIQSNPDNYSLRMQVAKLEPKYREVIDMVYFVGHTQDEVSKILDIPLGTVKTRARIGLQMLRSQA